MKLSIRAKPVPHLYIDAPLAEGMAIRKFPRMGYKPPGWVLSVVDLYNYATELNRKTPSPLLGKVRSACLKALEKGINVAFFLASNMEKYGWGPRPVVEAHELFHLKVDSLKHRIGVPGRRDLVKAILAGSHVTYKDHAEGHLAALKHPHTAVEEMMADLAGIKAGIKSGLSQEEAIAACGRCRKHLTGAMKAKVDPDDYLRWLHDQVQTKEGKT